MKSPTLEEYREAGEEFWPKYRYVAEELGDGVEPGQVLKVMESLATVALKKKLKTKLDHLDLIKNETMKQFPLKTCLSILVVRVKH